MNNPPEKPSRPETNLTPAEIEPASVTNTADFAKRLARFQAETRFRRNVVKWMLSAIIGGLACFFLSSILFAGKMLDALFFVLFFLALLWVGGCIALVACSLLLPPSKAAAQLAERVVRRLWERYWIALASASRGRNWNSFSIRWRSC